MILGNTLQLRAVRPPVVRQPPTRSARAAPPRFRLRPAIWATSCFRSPELWLFPEHLELHVRRSGCRVVHRVRFERVHRVQLVEGRFYTDVVLVTDSGIELVAPGIRNRDVAPARTHLAGIVLGRHPALRA